MEEPENQIVSMEFCSGSSHEEFGSGSQPSHEEFGSGSQPSQTSHAQTTATIPEDPTDVDKEPVKEQGRRAMADRSEWWGHFIKIKDNNDVVIAARCKYCSRQVKAETDRHGTSGMKRHFNVCKRNPHKFNKDPTQGTIQATYGGAVGTWKFDPDAIRIAFTEMIIVDELPFAFGEKAGFRKFMSIACPRFTVPSRRTTTRDVVKMFFKEKARLKKFFKDSCQRVCLTTYCWTSQQLDGYMTVTASFIDENWIMHKKIINFFLVKGHKGDDIGRNLVRCMAEWGMERVPTVTVDNASSNDSGIMYLRRHLNKSPSNIAKGKYLHMRCAAHIVNLIVQDGLKEVDLSIQRVRAAVRYIRNGGTRITKFKEIVVEEKVDAKAFLRIDVPTRWNSTFLMLKAANVYEKVFIRLGEEDLTYKFDLSEENDGYGCPEEADWENAKKMEEFLGHFYDLTTRVSATLHVTSNTFFHEIAEVHLLIKAWLESEDALQVAMGQRMKDKFDKYWGLWHINDKNKESMNEKGKGKGKGKEKEKENINLLIFVAAVVDPRYKLSPYTHAVIEEIFGQERGLLVWTAVTTCVNDLFEEYTKLYAPVEVTAEVEDSSTSKGGRQGMLKDVIAKKLKMNNGASSNSKSELDKYLAEDTEDVEMKLDILAWWKINESRFPVLAHLARDALAIPISSVASESAFSTSGRILDDFRTSLTPFMLEALVCGQDWLRRTTPIDIQESMEELAVIEKELIEEFGCLHISKGKADKKRACISKPVESMSISKPGT
ncbi:hypothetical protein ACQ4PT_024981 [Festuca glaucescens]